MSNQPNKRKRSTTPSVEHHGHNSTPGTSTGINISPNENSRDVQALLQGTTSRRSRVGINFGSRSANENARHGQQQQPIFRRGRGRASNSSVTRPPPTSMGRRSVSSSNVNRSQGSKFFRDGSMPRQQPVRPNWPLRKLQNNTRYQPRSESTQINFIKNRGMGFKYIQNLLAKEPHDIITSLTGSKEGFKQLLESNLTPDFIVLIIELLGKMCESKFNLLVDLLHIAFNKVFVEKLNYYITNLAFQADKQKNSYFWNDTDKFWENLLLVLKKMADIIPTFACQTLGTLPKVILINIAVIENVKSIHISDSIKDKCKILVELIDDLEKKLERKRAAATKSQDEGEPPNDFREISVYPTSFEITSTERNFVRRNIIEGPYQSVHHYLDVQFRLLREDFVKPLREGVNDYIHGSNRKIPNIVVHKKIHFVQPELMNEQNCYRIRFNFSQKQQSYTYENSKRFMFGSLVCFTQDFKSVIFGRIADRKRELLENGEVIIGFDDPPQIFYGVNYVMIECSIYFEPYFHVLSVMKLITEDDFPMKKYLIDVNTSKAYPKYLMRSDEPQPVIFTIQGTEFPPLLWPNYKTFYNLNASQRAAFEGALTQEFSIIQGPPGTGKTFLGLKIAQTLLENRHAWYKHTPIVVICYTNHALDQFLEGLLPFTQEIIRVGGQSKNENLTARNLSAQKMHFPHSYFDAREKVKNCAESIKKITNTLNRINRLTDVICIDDFKVVNREFVEYFKGNRNLQRQWLLEPGEVVLSHNNLNKNMANLAINTLTRNNNRENEQNDEPLPEDEPGNEYLFEDFLSNLKVFEPKSLLSLKCQRLNSEEAERALQILNSNKESLTPEQLVQLETCANSFYQIKREHQYLEQRLREGRNQRYYCRPPTNIDYKNLQHLLPDQRWYLYFYTLYQYQNHLLKEHGRLNIIYRKVTKQFNEIREVENLKIMKDNLVVGMTTTGAARLYASLQALKSPIVIVEEAAEVLEAHIVTSITRSCQHLILIGDHQQLKPSTSDFQMQRDYNLGISLFERMVLNKVKCFTLNVQHRMRPEISRLITPTIYTDLYDHPSVKERDLISGIDNCVFFLDHQEKEEECSNTSKKNVHEATFLIRLARHLILNGYKAENITIIAAYLGQMYEMFRERKLHQNHLGDVRITVLDNYQGEESDIILLSLVRSNEDNKIGFLSIENRVCVALSRARDGFYMMGNMGQLSSQSKLWEKIKTTLENQYSIGPSLRLRCQVHTDKTTNVTTAADFNKISEGGCDQQCGAVLPCNHICQSLCHILDRSHKNYNCHEPCTRLLCDTNPSHLCKKQCYQECGPCDYKVTRLLPCNHEVDMFCYENPDEYKCLVGVETKLPCEHVVMKPCHADPSTFKCPEPCVTRVEPCGHACKLTCHVRKDPDHLEYKCTQKCAKYRLDCSKKIDSHLCPKLCYQECEPCTLLVDKKRTICPHQYKVPCCEDVDATSCNKPCKEMLQCGHLCKKKCFEPCGPCKVKVEQIVPDCKHTVRAPCSETNLRKYCTKVCLRIMTCGHKCQAKCFVKPCKPLSCKEIIECSVIGDCGHDIKTMQCNIYQQYCKGELKPSDPEIWSQCDYPCDKKLNCSSKEEDKHTCAGTCGKCFQGRLHLRCQAKCGSILVCNHECPIPCRETCQPCQKKCTTKCVHSRCSKKCGEPCTPCRQPCTRKCKHVKCKRNCGALCQVPPCTEPCHRTLKCGHFCVGFCGDPCPPLCRICNKEELEEIFFGNEDDPDVRFVYLNDCKHVLESDGLEEWLNQDAHKVSIKVCPKCKTPVLTTKRFSDNVKEALRDIDKIKEKIFGSEKNNNAKRAALLEKATKLHQDFLKIPMQNSFNKILHVQNFGLRLQPVKMGKRFYNVRQQINNTELVAIENKLLILKNVQQISIDAKIKLNDLVFEQLQFIVDALCRSIDYITNQEYDDIHFEIMRLQRMLQFEKIRNQESYQYGKTKSEVECLENKIRETLFKRCKFTTQQFETVKADLEQFSKEIGSTVFLSDRERVEIVKAMGFSKGHWYKCPNGHYYCIADCGGANQVSKCNECGASIGGTGHRLLTGNMLAPEIDGARYSAWSEQANMANYRL